MPIPYFANVRKQRIQKLLKMLRENKDLDHEQVVALFAVQTGLTLRKAKEYYEVLKRAGLLKDLEKGVRHAEKA